MRLHATFHLLIIVCLYPITWPAVGEENSRVDFDIPDASSTKEDVTVQLIELIRANHLIYTRWISDTELAINPTLVKSKNVRLPSDIRKIRLVCIGDNTSMESQTCGGDHVFRTAEIGEIHIGKIEERGSRTVVFVSPLARCSPTESRRNCYE